MGSAAWTVERFTRKEFRLKYGHEPDTDGIVGKHPATPKDGDCMRVALTEAWDAYIEKHGKAPNEA